MEEYKVPRRRLYDKDTIPAIGMGTFGSDKYGPGQVAQAVYGGIRAGYRLIDCAAVYQNEDKIGEALERVIAEGSVEREDLFIASKVWNDMHGEGKVAESCEKSLRDLHLSYLDLYFIHWPFPNYHAPGCDGDSRNPDSAFPTAFSRRISTPVSLAASSKISSIGVFIPPEVFADDTFCRTWLNALPDTP